MTKSHQLGELSRGLSQNLKLMNRLTLCKNLELSRVCHFLPVEARPRRGSFATCSGTSFNPHVSRFLELWSQRPFRCSLPSHFRARCKLPLGTPERTSARWCLPFPLWSLPLPHDWCAPWSKPAKWMWTAACRYLRLVWRQECQGWLTWWFRWTHQSIEGWSTEALLQLHSRPVKGQLSALYHQGQGF